MGLPEGKNAFPTANTIPILYHGAGNRVQQDSRQFDYFFGRGGCYIVGMGKLDHILRETQELSEDERVVLAHHLLATGETGASPVRECFEDLDRRE